MLSPVLAAVLVLSQPPAPTFWVVLKPGFFGLDQIQGVSNRQNRKEQNGKEKETHSQDQREQGLLPAALPALLTESLRLSCCFRSAVHGTDEQ